MEIKVLEALKQARVLSADGQCNEWLENAIALCVAGDDSTACAAVIGLVQARATNPALLELLETALTGLGAVEEASEVIDDPEVALEDVSDDSDMVLEDEEDEEEPEEEDLSGLRPPDHDEQD